MTTYELHDLHQSLELSRSFIVSILWEAYRREDTEQIKEFEDKLKAVDEEIDKLTIYEGKDNYRTTGPAT
jgi:hypothetical protein